MVIFFKTPANSIIATQADHQLTADEQKELSWLYNNAELIDNENLEGFYVGAVIKTIQSIVGGGHATDKAAEFLFQLQPAAEHIPKGLNGPVGTDGPVVVAVVCHFVTLAQNVGTDIVSGHPFAFRILAYVAVVNIKSTLQTVLIQSLGKADIRAEAVVITEG